MSGLLHNGQVVGGENGDLLYGDRNHTAYWQEDKLGKYNAYNVLPHLADGVIDTAGLTGTIEGDVVTISGTTSAPFNLNLYSSPTALPDWWVPDSDLYLVLDKRGTAPRYIYVRILYYDANNTLTVFGSYNRDTTIHIPADFDGIGLIVRIYVATGRTVDGSVEPQLMNALTNAQLTAAVDARSDGFSNPPMLTIIDDDGNEKFYTELLPLIESRGVSITSAVIPSRAADSTSTHMTWENVVDASRRGAEIVNHTYNHLTGELVAEMTEQEVWLNFQKARNTIESYGLSGGKYLVFAGSSGSYTQAQKAAERSCVCSFRAGGNALNYRGELDPYYISRYRVQTDGYDYDPDQLKALIDNCLENGGWMVWMIHTSEAVWTSLDGLTGITAAIDYAIAQGLPIVSVDTGYRTYIA